MTKYQPAHGGNYAVKLTTIADPQNPGEMQADIVLNSFNPDPMGPGGGVPYSQKPTKLIVWAKYDVKPGDVANVGGIQEKWSSYF